MGATTYGTAFKESAIVLEEEMKCTLHPDLILGHVNLPNTVRVRENASPNEKSNANRVSLSES